MCKYDLNLRKKVKNQDRYFLDVNHWIILLLLIPISVSRDEHWSEQSIILFLFERGMARVSLQRSLRENPRKTLLVQTEDENNNIIFYLTGPKLIRLAWNEFLRDKIETQFFTELHQCHFGIEFVL